MTNFTVKNDGVSDARELAMNIYDLYHRMESNRVVLSFKGDVTSELMSSILQINNRPD
jgi:hypothetical protein